MIRNGMFASESVSEGHPDKLADRISDSVLDEFLREDPDARVACEALLADQFVVVAGEFRVRDKAIVDEISSSRTAATSAWPPRGSIRMRRTRLSGYCSKRSRIAALCVAHALLASCHTDASDRSTGFTPQDRQIARILGSAPASLDWLANLQDRWPSAYPRQWWIDIPRGWPMAVAPQHAAVDTNC